MKRVAMALVLAVIGWIAVSLIQDALATDEERIRDLFESEREAFNGSAALSIMEGFATDYRDTTLNISRQMLRAGLLFAFQNRRHADGGFRYRLELPAEDWSVLVEGETATATSLVQLVDRSIATGSVIWELRVEADLRRIEGDWRITGSTHETLLGGRPR